MEKMYYGGDYNPEQWPEETWSSDMKLLKGAGVDILTLNVFSWAELQPAPNKYDFSRLDKIMKMAADNDMRVCLATSTAAHPAWMAKRYPDILQVDFEGRKRKFGMRHNSCPCSPTYRFYSAKLAEKLASRYKDYKNIVAWHVSNEYGADCYCERCEHDFRNWLRVRYKSLDNLNKAWNTAFWGHTFYDWDEIVAPNNLSEHFGYNRTCFQGITIDYRRFQSDMTLENYKAEYKAIKRYTPEIPVTTNFMGYFMQLDYKAWAPFLDFISWDNYPAIDTEDASVAMWHDLMRGLKGGQSFWLMEQTPSVSNWNRYCALKRPGEMRLLSYEAVAHGADTVMFFQMRRSIGACEKFHGAIIDHVGTAETRVYKEAAVLGGELKKIGNATLNARTNSKAAIIFDWENWWSIYYSAGPTTELNYPDEVKRYYKGFMENHIPVDLIGPEDDFSKYEVIIAPVLHMVKGDFPERIREFTEKGGTFVTTFFSGYVNESDLIDIGGYPGKLRELMGIWVEEIDALPEASENHFDYAGKEYPARILCDLLHTEAAVPLSVYKEDFYAGMPVITSNNYVNGRTYYVATSSNDDFYYDFVKNIAAEKRLQALGDAARNIELTIRANEDGTFLFALNHRGDMENIKLYADTVDILTGEKFAKQEDILVGHMEVRILRVL